MYVCIQNMSYFSIFFISSNPCFLALCHEDSYTPPFFFSDWAYKYHLKI